MYEMQSKQEFDAWMDAHVSAQNGNTENPYDYFPFKWKQSSIDPSFYQAGL